MKQLKYWLEYFRKEFDYTKYKKNTEFQIK